eukprot:gene8944-27223_t
MTSIVQRGVWVCGKCPKKVHNPGYRHCCVACGLRDPTLPPVPSSQAASTGKWETPLTPCHLGPSSDESNASSGKRRRETPATIRGRELFAGDNDADAAAAPTSRKRPNNGRSQSQCPPLPKWLTTEQKTIVDSACPPGTPQIVRVTAAAGTGKTTVIIEVAKRLSSCGHTSIMYVTFNKTAAEDARNRIQSKIETGWQGGGGTAAADGGGGAAAAAGNCSSYGSASAGVAVNVLAKTSHSAAFNVVGVESASSKLVTDAAALDKIILSMFSEDIEAIIGGAVATPKERLRAGKKVAYFVRKTFEMFLQGTAKPEEAFKDGGSFMYYPSTKPPAFFTYDSVIKQAALWGEDGGEIQGITALLVDESQDMNPCQIEWLASHGRTMQVYFVGDAAQTIYGFRGARSKSLMGLPATKDFPLTKSFRFGSQIGAAANTILFAKEHSRQTSDGDGGPKAAGKAWQPYRVRARSDRPSVVRHGSQCSMGVQKPGPPLCVIAFGNMSLLQYAISLLINNRSADIGSTSAPSPAPPQATREVCVQAAAAAEAAVCEAWPDEIDFTKHLRHNYVSSTNHGGSLKKRFFNVFTGAACTIDLDDWADDNEGGLDWDEVIQIVNEREWTKYSMHVDLIETHRENTMNVVGTFKREILEKEFELAQADIILTTTHAAKGMEFDHVLMLDDFADLSNLHFNKTEKRWEFAHTNKGGDADVLNLWYVAITRAKLSLTLPNEFETVVANLAAAARYAHPGVWDGGDDDDDADAATSATQVMEMTQANPYLSPPPSPLAPTQKMVTTQEGGKAGAAAARWTRETAEMLKDEPANVKDDIFNLLLE